MYSTIFGHVLGFLVNMLNSKPMKYARIDEAIEKVLDGRTINIKEEKA